MNETPDKSGLRITSLTVADAAKILSTAYGQRIDENQVRQVAEGGGLIRADGTISLIEYTAYLAREITNAAAT